MVQLVIGLLHARGQSSTKRFPPVCQHWWSCNGDGVVLRHSTKYDAFRAGFCFVRLVYMSHLAGVLDDGTDDCSIHLVEMMGFYSRSLEQDNGIRAL